VTDGSKAEENKVKDLGVTTIFHPSSPAQQPHRDRAIKTKLQRQCLLGKVFYFFSFTIGQCPRKETVQ